MLEVRNLVKYFPGPVHAVNGVDFTVGEGESLGLVGESGSGKTTTGRLITRLLEPTEGQILFDGQDLARLKPRALKPLRRQFQMIFQDPQSSLNPRHNVGTIIAMPLKVNGVKGNHPHRVGELLELVGLQPEDTKRYPHEFSGGQRQRIGIARALALQPKLIVADEPVSALDVSIQAQIITLLRSLQRELGLAFVFISHDLAVVRHFCTRVAVMRNGEIVEQGDRAQIYEHPAHPYTKSLLEAIPSINR